MSEFKSSLPTNTEMRRMIPIESSRRVVAAFEEAKLELVRRGQKPLLADAAKLLGLSGSSSTTYQMSVNHVRAVDIYGISGLLAKQEAIRRMRLIDPTPGALAASLDAATEARSDAEILADAVSAVLIRAGKELPLLDERVMAGFLKRDTVKRGATRSALLDLQKWLSNLERAL